MKKNYNNSKCTCHIQCSNIVHCDWYTQKPIRADIASLLDAFFPVQTDKLFYFLSGGVKETTKISHFVDFQLEKCIKMAWVACI